MNFLSLFNDSNSFKNESNKEFIITAPINTDKFDKLTISSPCKITSLCDTKITCDNFTIKSPGVSLSNITFDSQLTIDESDNCSISNCIVTNTKESKSSVLITNSKNVTIDHLEISKSSNIGLYIMSYSTVTVTDSNIHDSNNTSILINSKSKLKIKRSQIHDSKTNGLYAYEQSTIEISNCSIFNTLYPCISIDESSCIIKNNEISHCEQNSVALCSCEHFLFENNTIKQAKSTGLSIQGCKGVIQNNRFYEIEGNAILCYDSSDSIIRNNELFDNHYPSIALHTKSKGLIEFNRIRRNKINGISVRGTFDVTIRNNEISDIVDCGISISDSDKITVEKNVISNCKVTAIESYNKSNAYVHDNIILDMDKSVFLAYTSGFIRAEKNRIEGVKNTMVKLAFKGSGEFVNNEVKNCNVQAECMTSSFYLFNKNGRFNGITNDPKKATSSIKLQEKFVDSNNSKLCLKCHKKPYCCFLVQCGHKVYCKECAELALKNHEACPLCRFPIENISTGFEVSSDNKCIICMSNQEDSIIMPCGHMGVCSECLDNWFKTSKSCPVCRAENCFYNKIRDDI